MATLTVDKPTDAVAALLQERQRYEQWLAVLESRRAATPLQVYTRVRGDYEGRLNRVIEELGGRTAELRQIVEALSQQVSTLESEESTKRDLQAEAELRAAVGEYSPEQWREVNQSSEAELSRIAAQRADAASELAQVQQLLNMASTRRPEPVTAPRPVPDAYRVPPPPPPGEATAPTPPPAAGGAARPAARPPLAPPAPATLPARGAPGGDQNAFDELAFLQSVVAPKPDPAVLAARPLAKEPPTRPPAPAPAAPAPVVRPRTPAIPVAAAPAAPPPVAKPAPPPAPAPAPSPVARPAVTPPEATSVVNTATGASTAATAARRGVMDSESVPVFLRDVPSEQVKTLKCAECGTMNYPTEWYCERCGGELAAM